MTDLLLLYTKKAKTMRSKKSIIITFFIFNFFMIQAQQEISISLNEVLVKVENNNHSIKISKQNYNAAKADYNQTNSILLPNISDRKSTV